MGGGSGGGGKAEKWRFGHGFRARQTAWPPATTGQALAVELGCGRSKVDGLPGHDDVLGVDWHEFEGVHVVTDLDAMAAHKGWAWAEESSCSLVICHQTLEHLRNLIPVMNEIWRICDEEAHVEIVVPYGIGKPALQDPTHVRFFTEMTFRYWEPGFVDDFSDYGIRGYFAICAQDWRQDGNLWVLLAPLTEEEAERWRELRALTDDGIVRWPAPQWLLDRGAMLLGDAEP